MKGLIRAHCLNLFFLTMLGPVVRGKGKTFKRFIRTKSYLVCFAVARARERDMLVIFGKGQIYLADQAPLQPAASYCLAADFLGYLSRALPVLAAAWLLLR